MKGYKAFKKGDVKIGATERSVRIKGHNEDDENISSAVIEANKNDVVVWEDAFGYIIKSIAGEVQIRSNGDYVLIRSHGDGAQISSSGNYAKINSSGNDAQIGSSGCEAQINSSGTDAKIGASGYGVQINSNGNYAGIGTSGYNAKINSKGKNSVICCIGDKGKAKGKIGSWIILTEWKYSEEEKHSIPVCVKAEKIDGKRIKEDTYYELIKGEFVEYGRKR